MFNRTLATVRAFLRDTLTTDHALYQDVSGIATLPEPVKRPKRPQDPAQASAIRHVLGDPLGRIWWTLCCTGMLPDEYFAETWVIEDGRLHVKGTKRAARDRYVPLLEPIEPPGMTQAQFQTARRRSGLGVRPKDGRDSFAFWCDMAGVPQGLEARPLGPQRPERDTRVRLARK